MPDIFGQETPQEVLARIRASTASSRESFASTAGGQSAGGQAGLALGAIFGPSLSKFVQTRKARRAAQSDGVPQQDGSTKVLTKAEAKEAIPFGYQAVRSAEKTQQYSADAGVLLDSLNKAGGNPEMNRAQVMDTIAVRLKGAGEINSGNNMSQRAADIRRGENERLADLGKVRATTRSAEERADQIIQDVKFKAESESDTFAKITNGKLENITEVAKGDIDVREKMRDSGFIRIGPGGISTQLSEAVLTRTKPVDTEALGFQFGMLDSLEVMQRVAPEVGFGTPILALMAERGIDLFGSGKFIEAAAHGKAIRAGIQSIIKGIPSNYDASIFEAMIPNLFRFQDGEFYQAQIDVLNKQTKDLIILNIAAHKGSREPMPFDILQTAKRYGIDVESIEGIPESEQFSAVRALEKMHRQGFAELREVQPDDAVIMTEDEFIDKYRTK